MTPIPSAPRRPARARTAARGLVAALLFPFLAAGCAEVVRVHAGGPVTLPGEAGAVRYQVGKLSFEVPGTWPPRGDSLRLSATHPEEQGRLDVQVADKAYRDEAECLAQAEAVLGKGAGGASNVRRHPTTFAGRKGVAQEGDQGAWHGWAWGVCDGASQYRVSFWGATPLREDVLAAWSRLSASARFEP